MRSITAAVKILGRNLERVIYSKVSNPFWDDTYNDNDYWSDC